MLVPGKHEEQGRLETAQLQRAKAEEVALSVLRDRHADEYAVLVAQAEKSLEAASQGHSGGGTTQARL